MKTNFRSNRGSALFITLTFTIALAIVVGSYLSLVSFNLKSSHRNYNSSGAMDLADAGIEEAMWAINRVAVDRMTAANAYPTARGWTINGTVARATFTFNDANIAANRVNVQVSNCDLSDRTTRPKIKVQSVLSTPGISNTEKWVEIALDATPTVGPSKVAAPFKGLVAKNSITFNGNNPFVDSYDTRKGHYNQAIAGGTNKNDHGFVGSTSVSVDQVLIRQADILGYVATFNDADLSNNVGNNGSITGFNTPTGLKIDPQRVSTDFTASLPGVAAPTEPTYAPLGNINSSLSLPRAGDVAQDGYYYYSSPSISLSSSDSVTITGGNVVINVTGMNGVSTTGQAYIQTDTNASLNMYVSGDINLAGQGIFNGTPTTTTDKHGNVTSTATNANVQPPANFTIWGTSTSSQTVKVAGNGALSAVVYAPNGEITITGNGDVMGAIIGNTITLGGNGVFHYDESLGALSFTDPTAPTLSQLVIYRWRELLDGAERQFL